MQDNTNADRFNLQKSHFRRSKARVTNQVYRHTNKKDQSAGNSGGSQGFTLNLLYNGSYESRKEGEEQAGKEWVPNRLSKVE